MRPPPLGFSDQEWWRSPHHEGRNEDACFSSQWGSFLGARSFGTSASRGGWYGHRLEWREGDCSHGPVLATIIVQCVERVHTRRVRRGVWCVSSSSSISTLTTTRLRQCVVLASVRRGSPKGQTVSERSVLSHRCDGDWHFQTSFTP